MCSWPRPKLWEAPEVAALAKQSCPSAAITIQTGADLGERMLNAVREALVAGYPAALIVGTDAPHLPWARIEEALTRVLEYDLILGPCRDGGYYLVGMCRALPELFENVPWSTAAVLQETLHRAAKLSLRARSARPLVRCRHAGGSDGAFAPTWPRRAGRRAHPLPANVGVAADASRGSLMDAGLAVIIPARNEERSIAAVLEALPADLAPDIIVVDNGSTDRTAELAEAHGARVGTRAAAWLRRGVSGRAGVASGAGGGRVLDADLSDEPQLLRELVRPIFEGSADFVIGSRMLGEREPGALPPHSRFGNWLAGRILTRLYGQATTDLGPFRAIRYATLQQLHMEDRGFGWTMEMQAKAARLRVRTLEIPVPYRKRVGRSKITGSLRASVAAGVIILVTAARLLRWRPPQ